MKTFLIVAASVVGVIAIGVIVVVSVIAPSHPNTPKRAAHILITDKFLPGRALPNAKAYGDRILEPLRQESHDFTRLDSWNAVLVAQVLAADSSSASLKLSRELYERKVLYPKLVGAVGLSARGEYPEPISAPSFLVRVALDKYPHYSEGDTATYPKEGYDILAILALGYSKDPAALPFLTKALNGENQWSERITAIYVALAILGDRRAIPELETSIRSKRGFAVAPLYAALSLGDKGALPLAFPRLINQPKYVNVKQVGRVNVFLQDFLEAITNQHFGDNVKAWQDWWFSEGAQWKIPKSLPCEPCFPYAPSDP